MALMGTLRCLVAVMMFVCAASAQQTRVSFPPGRPTSENIRNICLHGNARPRYPLTDLPNGGHGTVRREADVIHRTEAWYSQQCCQGDWEKNTRKAVCCALHAWKKTMDILCEEESMIKTQQRSCCQVQGKERRDCFAGKAPNPSYLPPSSPYTGPNVLPQGPAFVPPGTCSTMLQQKN
ncbi:extracellular matrix protein 1-like isoform X2 [Engraulis encrasicolus]|uniref:extracellular matrix protein 1-like isoform X2 n=1 Tax=Engraulis encrasicolus TaxID=184585 RepID=UPI002FCFB0B1